MKNSNNIEIKIPDKEFAIVGIVSDIHDGNIFSITHPEDNPEVIKNKNNLEKYKEYVIRSSIYNWVKAEMKNIYNKYGEPDLWSYGGDIIEGAGAKNRGLELFEPDRDRQVEMAVRTCQSLFPCKRNRVVLGTKYHDGDMEPYTRKFAEKMGATYSIWDRFHVRGLQFDQKHKVSGGGLPHTKYGGIAREELNSRMFNVYFDIKKQANIYSRSHLHKWLYTEGAMGRNSCAFVTPCLKGIGEEYGQLNFSSPIDVGFVLIIIKNQYEWHVEKHLMDIKFMVPKSQDGLNDNLYNRNVY